MNFLFLAMWNPSLGSRPSMSVPSCLQFVPLLHLHLESKIIQGVRHINQIRPWFKHAQINRNQLTWSISCTMLRPLVHGFSPPVTWVWALRTKPPLGLMPWRTTFSASTTTCWWPCNRQQQPLASPGLIEWLKDVKGTQGFLVLDVWAYFWDSNETC